MVFLMIMKAQFLIGPARFIDILKMGEGTNTFPRKMAHTKIYYIDKKKKYDLLDVGEFILTGECIKEELEEIDPIEIRAEVFQKKITE